ncbi:MAG: phage holin family protein [Patescibacteria group bacterium]
MNILINWILSAVTVFASAYVLPGIHVQNFTTALIAALVIGIINAFLKPVLTILTLPITIITLGIFSFVLNAFLIMIADYLVPGFKVDGFFWALILSLILTIVGSIYHNFVSEE